MSLPAIWSDAAYSHDPGGEVWVGIPIVGDETPGRAGAFLAALESVGAEIRPPDGHPDTKITAVHDPAMLRYLESAHADWLEAGYGEDPGQSHVIAYAFRHPGAFDHVAERWPESRAARAGMYCMDTTTAIGPGTYRGARYAVDAALTAADLVLSGAPASYAACRPPGHHAGHDYFGGSCYLNNAAIAAQHLLDAGIDRVGLVDIDAHHGNGTQQLFYERPDVVYASVHIDPGTGWYPHWSGFPEETGSGPGAGFNHNLPLAPGDGDEEMVARVTTACDLIVEHGCEVLLVSLGVDSGAADPNSPLTVTTSGFGEVGRLLESVGLPTVLVQEGGYDLPSLQEDLAAILTRFSSRGGADHELEPLVGT